MCSNFSSMPGRDPERAVAQPFLVGVDVADADRGEELVAHLHLADDPLERLGRALRMHDHRGEQVRHVAEVAELHALRVDQDQPDVLGGRPREQRRDEGVHERGLARRRSRPRSAGAACPRGSPSARGRGRPCRARPPADGSPASPPESAGRRRPSRSPGACSGPRSRSPTCRGSAPGSGRPAWRARRRCRSRDPATLLTFVPDATATSYIVTVGPRWAPTTRASTPKVCEGPLESGQRVLLRARVRVGRRRRPEQVERRKLIRAERRLHRCASETSLVAASGGSVGNSGSSCDRRDRLGRAVLVVRPRGAGSTSSVSPNASRSDQRRRGFSAPRLRLRGDRVPLVALLAERVDLLLDRRERRAGEDQEPEAREARAHDRGADRRDHASERPGGERADRASGIGQIAGPPLGDAGVPGEQRDQCRGRPRRARRIRSPCGRDPHARRRAAGRTPTTRRARGRRTPPRRSSRGSARRSPGRPVRPPRATGTGPPGGPAR